MHYAITGASSGIGEALAKRFDAKGNQLTLVARRTELLQTLAASLEADTLVCTADLSDIPACCDWVDQAEAKFGPIDVLINNAGIQYVEPALELTAEKIERIMSVNVTAPMLIIRRVGPTMVERQSGAIVNIASMAGITPTPGMCHYNGTKAALGAMSESLAVELKSSGVHVLTVYPGPVSTAMEKAARDKFAQSGIVDQVPTGTTEGLAKLVAKGLRKQHRRLVYPRVYGVARHFRVTAQWVTDTFTPAVES